jgi:hypothetical protein
MQGVVRDDVPPPPPEATLSDGVIAAACALCEEAAHPAPGELPLRVRLRAKRAAARARDACARRRAAERQVVGYLELLSEPGARRSARCRAERTG